MTCVSRQQWFYWGHRDHPSDHQRAGLHVRSVTSSVHVPALDAAPVLASEPLDGESGWRMLAPGELVHVRPDLTVESAVVLPDLPARQLLTDAQNGLGNPGQCAKD